MAPSEGQPRLRDLPLLARGTVVVLAMAAAAACLLAPLDGSGRDETTLLVILAVLCAASNLFEVSMPQQFSLQVNSALVMAGALLLDGPAILVLAVVTFLPALVLRRVAWFKLLFNASNYAVCAVAAALVADATGALRGSGVDVVDVTALLAAGVLFPVVNLLLLLVMISAAEEASPRVLVRALSAGLSLEVALCWVGATLAVLWWAEPAALALATGVGWLGFRAISASLFEHQAQTDSKTGLANFGRFQSAFGEMLEEARRTGRPLSVLMLDLDHLREINNVEGHLTGDRAIRAISDVLAVGTPPDGLAARFGGEEFCVLLPSTPLDEAVDVAERLRGAVAASAVATDEPGRTLAITVSVGVACWPWDGSDAETLTKAADVAVYEAKAAGRDRVAVAPGVAAAVA